MRVTMTALAAAGVLLWACSERGGVTEPGDTPVKASDWVKSVNWDDRTVVT
ncbi:MAG: hypothetical protein HY701_11620, partial [Gemmatimonadetes bacterium]|nr:hypothetical protein [Gemmatimonadota bacterium]